MDLSGTEKLIDVVRKLRSKDGCPWDRVQTHESLKSECIEEAAEVIGGINILTATGDPANLKEELGDLLLQVVFHAQLAQEEGLFTFDDVAQAAAEKMIRRHPNIFGEPMRDENGNPVTDWEGIKRLEKKGREWEADYLPDAFREAKGLIDQACRRKDIHPTADSLISKMEKKRQKSVRS